MAGRIITAIDIGSTKISTIIASMEEGGTPAVIGVATSPSQGLKKGVIVNIDDAINSIANSLEAAERMAGLTVSSIYISINGKHITSLNNKGVVAIAQEEITTEDVFRSIESARTVSIPPSRDILHVIPREFIVDAQGDIKDPIGMTGTRLEVNAHIISATTSALHNLVKCVQQIGLQVDDIVFTGWASSTSVLTPTEKELGIMCLDIGGGTTSITTFVEDAITYSSSVPFGGINITSDLAIGLRVSLEEAEKIKLNAEELMKNTYVADEESEATKRRKALLAGESEEEEDDDKKETKKKKDVVDISSLDIKGMKTMSRKLFNEIVEARLSEIFDIVIRQVEQSGNETRLPAGIVITGGSALIPGIASVAKKVFGVPARVAYPKGLGGLVDEISSPAYAVGHGLVLYGSSEEGFETSTKRTTAKSSKKSGGIGNRISSFFKNLLP
ncbi:MAG TPA: cell division protein FtsA [Candidatus Dojkabacteria bacterium]|nr:cell division protein FtsA [Candidatus Dojkabacteria bacterium]HRO64680.1 cell division protein FtsA [Candidatus Dojkabacteria bacterium]HRP51026.1 cell division protein FtsA [Candidatus Dojkabacteria bacterium]